MGRKLDALMGRSKSLNQLKPLLNLALSRLAVLKSQRKARCSISRSDVVQLLNLNQHDRALLRVEQVIKEENMMDVFVMVEGYCFMILERIHLIEQHEIRECPEEANEAVSSLIYAASRCGEFPELQEIRAIFTDRYGKEFAARAIELRNNCSVNRQMIVKLSPRQPDLKSRLKILNEIAAENNIVLHIQDITDHDQEKEQVRLDQKYNNNNQRTTEEELTDSIKRGRQYKDVAEAAQAAFESAAHAAAAARAAVELSKPRDDVTDSQEEIHQSKDEEEIVKTTTSKEQDEEEIVKTTTSKEQDECLHQKEMDSSSENQTSDAKPETNRFILWTRRKLRWSRPEEKE